MQGILGGVAFGAGYGIGVLWRWLWHYLELPEPRNRLRSRANLVVGLVCLAVAVVALYFAAGWQNSVRAVMDMEPVPSAYPMSVSALAVLTFLVLLILVRLLILLGKFVSAKVQLVMPRRLANVLGITITVVLIWTIANGLLIQSTFKVLDRSFREFDALIEPDRPQPTSPNETGSAASLYTGTSLGGLDVSSFPRVPELPILLP